MKIIKEHEKYILMDCRNTIYEGNYQLREKTTNFPKGETCGVYKTKKEAIEVFKQLIK